MLAHLRNRRVIQNSWVVADLDAAMQNWIETTGIGPFFVVSNVPIEEQKYRGRDTSIDVTIALAQAGDIQIELVAQHNAAPSAYRDLVPAGQSAFHHVAFYSTDYDADLKAYTDRGIAVAFSGSFAGKRFCYLDTSPTLGHMVELIEDSAAQRDFFAKIRAAAADWDGSNAIRPAF